MPGELAEEHDVEKTTNGVSGYDIAANGQDTEI